MGDLLTSSIFHVIYSKGSYKLLLGHLWLHKHEMVASTLYQCLKYHCGGKKKINSNVKSFTKAESHFVESKFFEEGTVPKETVPSIISSTSMGEPNAAHNSKVVRRHDSMKQKEYCKGDVEQ